MRRPVLIKAGLILAGASLVALGIAVLALPAEVAGFRRYPGDRVAGGGLILCGLVFAFFALKVRTETDSPPAP
ncbi:MAG: hypothetical protein L0216_15655 [Planctomycetales bacterium]|nr:hypothetical protein [Planctomycetales bacterium]